MDSIRLREGKCISRVCSDMPAFSGLPLSSQVQLPVFLLGDTPYSILHKNIPSESESPQFCLTLCGPMNYSPWNSPGKIAGVGSLSLLQKTFPTQGSNPGWPLISQADSLPAKPQEKPKSNPKSLIKPQLGPIPRLTKSAYLRAGPEGISQGICTVHTLPCCCVVLVTQSCLTLCKPMYCSPPGSLSMGFPRQEYWEILPFPSPVDLPDPGIKPRSPALQADSLPSEPGGGGGRGMGFLLTLTSKEQW